MFIKSIIIPVTLLAALIMALPAQALPAGPKHILFAFVDHFEPLTPAIPETDIWVNDFSALASRHTDADGQHPKHDSFVFWAGYENASDGSYHVHPTLEKLNKLAYGGYGEINYHLHHGQRDESLRSEQQATSEFVSMTTKALFVFNTHGALLTAETQPRRAFGFIHGMWALDNSRTLIWNDPASTRQYCGVNAEISLLSSLGCFADYTFRSPLPMSPKRVDSIFYVTDDSQPASYQNPDNIHPVEAGKPQQGDLMIIEGPDFTPEQDNANIGILPGQYNNPPTLGRMDTWVRHNVHVTGREDWIFVKVYTHGCQYDLTYYPTWDAFFGPTADRFYSDIERKYNDGVTYKLHYVSAREMYNIAKAAEAGMSGDPGQYRDYTVPPYANMKIYTRNKYHLLSYTNNQVQLQLLDGSQVDVALKDFKLPVSIQESADLINWNPSNAISSAGDLGEVRLVDSTPSAFYQITDIQDKRLADSNNDNCVNNIELFQLSRYWLNTDCTPDNEWCGHIDFDHSGCVDVHDLWFLLKEWLH